MQEIEFNDDKDLRSWPRRTLFKAAACAMFPSLMTLPQGLQKLIIRAKEPENFEFVFTNLDSFITPNDRFYVRTHFAVPKLKTVADWKLKVEGLVDRVLEITYEELIKMPSKKVTTTMECAGNGRVYLVPIARGVQWEQGAVSTAEWEGVPLSAVLEKAGIKGSALEVVLQGMDSGELKDPPKPAGNVTFARSLPLEKAMHSEVLLAYKMNGERLPLSHGFPIRVVVPGWFGMACVKWLSRILVVDQPFQGHFQTVDYAYWQTKEGLPRRTPIQGMLVKSQIARPTFKEQIRAGQVYRVYGAAWAGEAAIETVEVSVNNGQSWQTATLVDAKSPNVWTRWSMDWTPTKAGTYTLLARATDSKGNVQPVDRDGNRENYMINQIVPIEVEVI